MSTAAPLPTGSALPDALLGAVLDVSLTAIVLLRPRYDEPTGAVLVDFTPDYLNPAGQRLLGLPDWQAAGSLRTRFPHAESTGIFAFFRRVFETGEAARHEVNYQADGHDSYVRLSARRNGEQLVVSFTAAADHARHTMEQALRASQARERAARAETETQRFEVQRVFEQTPVGVAVLRGPQYLVEAANPAVCALWGRAPAQALGRPLFELLPEAAGQGFKEVLDKVLATGVPFVAHEQPVFIDRPGNHGPVYWTFIYHPLIEADGHITGITVVASDVSSQVLARQQVLGLNQQLAALNDKLYAANAALGHANDELGDANDELAGANEQLVRTNEELDTFVYTASHDLQGPITNIEGLVQALLEELPPASQVGPVARVLGLLQDSVERFQHTIGHLTAIARLQHESGQPLPAVCLADVIRDVHLDLAPLLAETGGQLTVDVHACDTLHFAEKNLRSVVYNLLSNAFKYRHPNRVPQVHISCRPKEPYWVLEVRDNGLGLRLTPDRPLFGLFQRYHSHVEGSGVGLYMVKKMVENAGGRVEVRSEPEVGSSFSVYLRR